jgi:hypothetical protein
MLLHQHHEEQQQQQQQQGTSQVRKRQHRADLLSITAFHEHLDMLQLLPGGQAYLDVIPAWAAGEWGMVQEQIMEACRARTDTIVSLLTLSLQNCCYSTSWITSEVQRQGRGCALLSPSAMRLTIELQLLAAAAVQRQRQSLTEQQQQQQWQQVEQLKLMLSCNWLLVMQIRAAVFTQGGCLPPEVLQQAGLQLLQALTAPLQQMQLQLGTNRNLPAFPSLTQDGVVNEQLYALQAAAAGALLGPTIEGEQARIHNPKPRTLNPNPKPYV